MAAADYRLCDVCNGKVFYDEHLDYRFTSRQDPIEKDEQARCCGKPQGYRLQYLGDWAVICEVCARTHRTVILPIGGSEGEGRRAQTSSGKGDSDAQ